MSESREANFGNVMFYQSMKQPSHCPFNLYVILYRAATAVSDDIILLQLISHHYHLLQHLALCRPPPTQI